MRFKEACLPANVLMKIYPNLPKPVKKAHVFKVKILRNFHIYHHLELPICSSLSDICVIDNNEHTGIHALFDNLHTNHRFGTLFKSEQ